MHRPAIGYRGRHGNWGLCLCLPILLAFLVIPPAVQASPNKSFAALELIPDASVWPYRGVCKVFSTIDSVERAGSGVLIGPRHVLTAGHLVHWQGSWASKVEVAPGYADGVAPYGRASSRQNFAWPGWINSMDYTDNIGLIELERPVGAVTGYFSFGYEEDTFFSEKLFNNPGYPSFAPEYGEKLYIWYGNFDSVSSTLLGINGSVYGGHGGAGMYVYTPATQQRTVYGILSHSAGPTVYAVRLSNGRVEVIQSLISQTLASAPDLIPLHFTSSAATVPAGTSIAGMQFTCYNDSTASFSGLIPVRIHLSSDAILNAADTLLLEFGASIALAAQADAPILVPEVPVPGSVHGGEYYLFAELILDDDDSSNNWTGPDDALSVSIISPYHTADQNGDWFVNVSELLRVIQLFNSSGYHCDAGGEDGYGLGAGDASCTPHASDYNTQDWMIVLGELLRVIQFFNSGGYHACVGGEDGFCPGPL